MAAAARKAGGHGPSLLLLSLHGPSHRPVGLLLLHCVVPPPQLASGYAVLLPPSPTSSAGEFEFDFEEAQLTEQTVRELVYEEVQHYHP